MSTVLLDPRLCKCRLCPECNESPSVYKKTGGDSPPTIEAHCRCMKFSASVVESAHLKMEDVWNTKINEHCTSIVAGLPTCPFCGSVPTYEYDESIQDSVTTRGRYNVITCSNADCHVRPQFTGSSFYNEALKWCLPSVRPCPYCKGFSAIVREDRGFRATCQGLITCQKVTTRYFNTVTADIEAWNGTESNNHPAHLDLMNRVFAAIASGNVTVELAEELDKHISLRSKR